MEISTWPTTAQYALTEGILR